MKQAEMVRVGGDGDGDGDGDETMMDSINTRWIAQMASASREQLTAVPSRQSNQ